MIYRGRIRDSLTAVFFFGNMEDRKILCKRCIGDYRTAGYWVKVLPDKNREPCDKCERQGYECIVKSGGEAWQMKKI